ncbi:MAG: putative endonuclease [Pseudomonadota bacterium]|jgi:deoxyribonuclease V
MDIPPVPPGWLAPPDLTAAAAVQRELAARVRVRPLGAVEPGTVRLVAGVDVSNRPRDPRGLIWAAVVVFAVGEATGEGTGEGRGQVVEVATARRPAPMPYVPGFLGFREVPALLAAFAALTHVPDLVMVDGHGIAHPRGLGIAAHLGVLLDRPCFGVAKSILVGDPAEPLAAERGAAVPLVWKGREIGTVLRTKRNVAPVYLSVGQDVTQADALAWTLRLSGRTRLPDPTRAAHEAANAARRADEAADKAAAGAAAGERDGAAAS